METSKYLIVDSHGLDVPVVFSPLLSHSSVATGLGKIISAGFCYRNDSDTISVYGKSVTLGLKCRKQDAEIINEQLEREL